MLPSIIFGGFSDAFSPDDPDTPILNSSKVINENLTKISTSVSTVLSESLADTLAAIDSDYAKCTADGKEIINPHESSPNFNANSFISQYCAAKNTDYSSVSVTDMESILRNNKDKLYSYREIEEIPGSYYVARSIDQAFWAVINDDTIPKDAVSKWALIADEEISRKIDEYS